MSASSSEVSILFACANLIIDAVVSLKPEIIEGAALPKETILFNSSILASICGSALEVRLEAVAAAVLELVIIPALPRP